MPKDPAIAHVRDRPAVAIHKYCSYCSTTLIISGFLIERKKRSAEGGLYGFTRIDVSIEFDRQFGGNKLCGLRPAMAIADEAEDVGWPSYHESAIFRAAPVDNRYSRIRRLEPGPRREGLLSVAHTKVK